MNDNVVRFFRELYTQLGVENIVALPTGNAYEVSAATSLVYVAIGNQGAPVVLNLTLPVPIAGRKIKLIWSLGNNLTMQLKSNAGVSLGSPLSSSGTLTIQAADYTWYVDIDTLSDDVTDLAAALSAVEEITTAAATQEVTVDTDLTIQAPDYALLTQINDSDSDGKVIVVTPPAVPHVSRLWMCEVVAVGTTTVTVELGDADIASLGDGDLVVCMHNGEAWIALNNLFAAHA